MTNATIAQAIADVQYCTTELTPTQYTDMLYEGCRPTPQQYNVAITAAYSTSSNAPGSPSSSSSSSNPSSGTSGSASSSATGSAAVLAINTLISGLALGLIIMFAAGL
ncbi:hypothetical protein BVRB_034710 [Beta vulgaris subsp. vulgaris]|uniref:Uncharacterized protein n=1 Tax=Beta vulgaris subsp. vulgaris TaxID=3555 RepID=A0A0J7YPY1_BETVV|nr:hypothetical protein BVRB_034710 [Beta vulgaris subsp. vulgaris]